MFETHEWTCLRLKWEVVLFTDFVVKYWEDVLNEVDSTVFFTAILTEAIFTIMQISAA